MTLIAAQRQHCSQIFIQGRFKTQGKEPQPVLRTISEAAYTHWNVHYSNPDRMTPLTEWQTGQQKPRLTATLSFAQLEAEEGATHSQYLIFFGTPGEQKLWFWPLHSAWSLQICCSTFLYNNKITLYLNAHRSDGFQCILKITTHPYRKRINIQLI